MLLRESVKVRQRENPTKGEETISNPHGHREGETSTIIKTSVQPKITHRNKART